MECSRLNLLVIAISCLAVLAFPIFVTGCGDSGDDDDDMSGDVVAPDPEPVSEPTPQLEQQPQPEPPPQQQPEQQPQPEPPPQQPEQQPQPEPPPLPEPPPGVSFQQEILPILQASCAFQGCHADPNAKVGLNLETYAGFEKGSLVGPVFNPGDSNGSKVIQRIDGGGMPPGAPLADEKIQLFKDWIDEGAKNN
ncbi:hypothetical protein C6496_02320 [Candidatus Poribacteria bacterium]|nr:MAG: hypothetical protein C6496_02320 [Candidatus Poribacteria bacterium]